MLERLRVVIKVEPRGLSEMRSLDCTWLAEEAKRRNKPHLRPLRMFVDGFV